MLVAKQFLVAIACHRAFYPYYGPLLPTFFNISFIFNRRKIHKSLNIMKEWKPISTTELRVHILQYKSFRIAWYKLAILAFFLRIVRCNLATLRNSQLKYKHAILRSLFWIKISQFWQFWLNSQLWVYITQLCEKSQNCPFKILMLILSNPNKCILKIRL